MLDPGATLSVGSHSVTIIRFLSEGGYSRIYEVNMTSSGSDSLPRVACLKQVKVADKAGLTELRKEVDVMRTLRDARNIVKYYDSNAERMPDGTYQVLVLMELCPNKSLLEYMNSHIREKLSEKQILAIMMDIAVGVYEMHRIQLVHRDIKIENVLIDAVGRFKLCDFGSVSAAIRPPKDQQEFQILSHDILYHTTPQYRAPEMLDLTRGVPIDDKSDIWAIGCFLYKLCYYTTPFEAAGDMAILHASFLFPPAPQYSGDLKNLIIIMLQQDPHFRPNIVQILMLLAKMCNKDFAEMNIDDFANTGPYDFVALHEMQREMHKVLMQQQQQQQQYYYEQQKLVLRKVLDQALKDQRASSAKSLQDHLADSYLAPSAEQSPVAPPKVYVLKSGDVVNSVKLVGSSPLAVKVEAPVSSIPDRLRGTDGYSTPSRPSSAMGKNVVVVQTGSTKVPSRLLNPDVGITDEIDFLDLGNLDDVEHRFPSLDALDDVVASPSRKLDASYLDTQRTNRSVHLKKSSELENVEAWEKSRTRTFDSDAEKLVDDIFASTKPSTTNSNPTTNTGNAASAAKNAPESHKVPVVNAASAVSTVPTIDLAPAPELASSAPIAIPIPGLSASGAAAAAESESYNYHLSKLGLLGDVDQPISRLTSRSRPPVEQDLQPLIEFPKSPMVAPKDYLAKPALLNVSLNLQPFLQPMSRVVSKNQPQQQPQSLPRQNYSINVSNSPYLAPVKTSGGSSNPWGDALDRTPKMEPKSAVASISKIPDFELSKQILNLVLEEASPIDRVLLKHKAIDANLIELEVGLLSSSSINISTPTNAKAKSLVLAKKLTNLDDLSLIDLSDYDTSAANTTIDEAKSTFKRNYPIIRDPNATLQEEVIDFASDDENYKSSLSRVAIRQSLKKTRKSSDHRRSDSTPSRSDSQRRSSSLSGERKRLSFFGQGN